MRQRWQKGSYKIEGERGGKEAERGKDRHKSFFFGQDERKSQSAQEIKEGGRQTKEKTTAGDLQISRVTIG